MALNIIMLYGGVVFGNALSQDTEDRCLKAIKCTLSYVNANIIFCVDDRIPDLRRLTVEYLSKYRAVDRLIEKPQAKNSLEETKAAIEFIQQSRDEIDEVILVTSWYHMPRVRLLWKLLGYKGKVVCEPAQKNERLLYSLGWEVFAYIKLGYILIKNGFKL